MQIVIDIPDRIHYGIEIGITHNGSEACKIVLEAIKNGVPLDKIRAEIEENINYNKKMNYQGIVAGLLLTLDIINKYKAESEGRLND